MTAQKILEGEKYVTISLVPTIISKIRSDLVLVTTDTDCSQHIFGISTKRLHNFNTHWRSGHAGTIFSEHLTEGCTFF